MTIYTGEKEKEIQRLRHSHVNTQLLTCCVPGNTLNLANKALGVRSSSTRLIFSKTHTSTGENGVGEESERCGTFQRFHTRVSRGQDYEWIQWGWLANACRCIHIFTHSDISYHREVNHRIWPWEVRNACCLMFFSTMVPKLFCLAFLWWRNIFLTP